VSLVLTESALWMVSAAVVGALVAGEICRD
jgi:hypothetical protein